MLLPGEVCQDMVAQVEVVVLLEGLDLCLYLSEKEVKQKS